MHFAQFGSDCCCGVVNLANRARALRWFKVTEKLCFAATAARIYIYILCQVDEAAARGFIAGTWFFLLSDARLRPSTFFNECII